MKSLIKSFSALILAVVLSISSIYSSTALACSRGQYSDGKYSVVARTFDFTSDDVVAYGYPRGIKLKSSLSDKGFEYTTKYASIQMVSFGGTSVSDALNEKGLHASFLYLGGASGPKAKPNAAELSFEKIVQWSVSNFATIDELIKGLEKVNISLAISPELLAVTAGTDLVDEVAEGEIPNEPMHAMFTDASGDNLILEAYDGKLNFYHGKEHDVLTNNPDYRTQLILLEEMQYKPYNTIASHDRFASAKQYLADMKSRKVSGKENIIWGMRGLVSTVHAGMDELDPTTDEIFPTVWSVVVDQTDKVYYLEKYDKWAAEIYDFKSFDLNAKKAVKLTPRYSNS